MKKETYDRAFIINEDISALERLYKHLKYSVDYDNRFPINIIKMKKKRDVVIDGICLYELDKDSANAILEALRIVVNNRIEALTQELEEL